MKFRVTNEYIDNTLGRRILAGEEIELSAERVNTLKALGIGLTTIRGEPDIHTATAPKGEKAVTNRGNKRT